MPRGRLWIAFLQTAGAHRARRQGADDARPTCHIARLPVSQINASEEVSWVLDGDRGITYATKIPEGSNLIAGEWWPADYRGKPLVSFEAKVAEGLGLCSSATTSPSTC